MHDEPLNIVPEAALHQDAIHGLIDRAFFGKPYADGDEADLVRVLRAEDALSLSLAAVLTDQAEVVVGHIACSPAFPQDGSTGWYAIGPVAVEPERQGQGIGGRLMRAALMRLAGLGAQGIILTGDPNYYRRFGFALAPALTPANEPVDYFMAKSFTGHLPGITRTIRFWLL